MNNQRILVVDDEPNLSGLVRFYLEKTQRFVVRVENRSAQVVSVACEFQPDLILLDVDMPGKDGGQVAHEIEAVPALRAVPVVFLTSLISSAEAGACVKVLAGQRFLAKPVSAGVLVDAIDSVLAGKVPVA